jgi:hypothetical protein
MMTEEYKALVDNGTWQMVPRQPGANVVTSKWLYEYKFNFDDSLLGTRPTRSRGASHNKLVLVAMRPSIQLSNW